MAEINEAYSVLSDPGKRAEYDRLRQNTARNADTAFQDGDNEPAAGSPLDADWQTALQFYPELEDLRAGLGKISWKLAEGFRAQILGSKEFKDAQAIAARLEREFLSVYFGSNPEIIEFARTLIPDGRRDAARDLNRAVNVLGADTDPGRVIEVIRKKHGLSRQVDVFRWVDGAKRRGMTAIHYARDNGLDAEQVISFIQRGVLSAFTLDWNFVYRGRRIWQSVASPKQHQYCYRWELRSHACSRRCGGSHSRGRLRRPNSLTSP